MNRISIVFALAFILLSCAQGKVDENEIVIDDKSKLIDVRTEKEFKEGHLKNAINIPHTEIREKIEEHVKNKEEKIRLYCRGGRRAGIAKKILEEMGYENVKNAGAYEELKKHEEERKEQNE